MQSRLLLVGTLLAVVLTAAGCGRSAEPTPDAALFTVYAVNYPLHYFAERIGGDRIEVRFPAPPGVDPAEWRPNDETVLAYQQADLVLLNGAGYARWIQRVSLPSGSVVNTARGIQDRLLEIPDSVTHSHGPDGHTHTHAGLAFTTWLDPTLAIEHARAVKEALSSRLPDHREEFEGRFDSLAEDLRNLDLKIEAIVSRAPDKPLLASHPVYQYLETRYGLNLVSLHWEPEEMPGGGEWDALDAALERHPARWLLWEDEPLPEIAARLAERGVASVVFHPCSQPPEEGDFLTVMRRNAANLEKVFAGTTDAPQ